MGGCLQPQASGPVSQCCASSCSKDKGMTEAKKVLESLRLQPSERDCCRVQQICRMVVSRAATLCAAGLAAILSHMCQSRQLERLVVNVAVDSELYQGHSR